MYSNERIIAKFLKAANRTAEASAFNTYASERVTAMHAFMWNATHHRYFDVGAKDDPGAQIIFTVRDYDALPVDTDGAPSKDTQIVFNTAQVLPILMDAADPSILGNLTILREAFVPLIANLHAHKGGIPATNFNSSQQ